MEADLRVRPAEAPESRRQDGSDERRPAPPLEETLAEEKAALQALIDALRSDKTPALLTGQGCARHQPLPQPCPNTCVESRIGSAFAAAIDYSLNRWTPLGRFLEDGN